MNLHRLPIAQTIALLLALLASASCRSGPIAKEGALDLDEVPAAIERARSTPVDSASDDELAEIVGSLLQAGRAPIETDQRVAVNQLLDRTAEELSLRGTDLGDLKDLSLTDLPARISVPAGLRAARMMLEQDDRSDAFRLIRKIDVRYPSHALRDEAGDLLYEVATSYRTDTRRRLFLFPYKTRAPAVYEYLSTEYPKHEKTDDALLELAEIYENDRIFDVAIDKHKELVLWAPDSEFRVASEAAIPRLRLEDLDGPEYGRDQLMRALDELDRWVERHGDHELRSDVDITRIDCLQRLADNDLVVAKFYRRVKSPTGARQHAERGLGFAIRSGNVEQQEEIREFLASVDEIERVEAPDSLPDAPSFDAFDPAGTGTSTPSTLAPSSSPLEDPARQRRRQRDERQEAAPGPGSGLGDPTPVGTPPAGNSQGGGN